MSYIYNVTIKVESSIEQDWLHWMQDVHMQDVLNTGMFDTASLFMLVEPVDDEANTYVAQYITTDEQRYKTYIEHYAPKLRQDGFDRFGNRFIAFRSLLRKL